MNLTVDIGNTRAKFGVFDGHDLLFAAGYEHTAAHHGYGELTAIYNIENCIVSSVGNFDLNLDSIADRVIYLDHHTPLPIRNLYSTPDTLGKDRIAAVVAAHHQFVDQDVLTIDAGTCVTYDFVDAQGVYHGGNIAPGLDMRLRAMHDQTARLPLVERGDSDRLVGQSTTEAMQNGAVIGILLEIDGYIRRLRRDNAGIVTVMTGGDASYLSERLKTEIFVRPNLVLIGLNEILIHNVA